MSLNQPVIDNMTFSSQFGRLDLVSTLLAITSTLLGILTIILAIAGYLVYVNFRKMARDEAEKAAEKFFEENSSMLIEAFEKKAKISEPNLSDDAVNRITRYAASDNDTANDEGLNP